MPLLISYASCHSDMFWRTDSGLPTVSSSGCDTDGLGPSIVSLNTNKSFGSSSSSHRGMYSSFAVSVGLFCSVCKSLCSGVELFHSLCLTLTGGVGGVCVGNLKGYSKQKIK